MSVEELAWYLAVLSFPTWACDEVHTYTGFQSHVFMWNTCRATYPDTCMCIYVMEIN
jgi:hypothetical protein